MSIDAHDILRMPLPNGILLEITAIPIRLVLHRLLRDTRTTHLHGHGGEDSHREDASPDTVLLDHSPALEEGVLTHARSASRQPHPSSVCCRIIWPSAIPTSQTSTDNISWRRRKLGSLHARDSRSRSRGSSRGCSGGSRRRSTGNNRRGSSRAHDREARRVVGVA